MKFVTLALLASLSFSAAAQGNTTPKSADKPGADTVKQEPAKRVARTKGGRMLLTPMTADQFTRRK